MKELPILREVEGDNPKPVKRPLSAEVRKLISAGLITEKAAQKALNEGTEPKLLLEG